MVYCNDVVRDADANQSRWRPGSKYSSITTQRLKKRDDGKQEGRRQRSLRGQWPLTSAQHKTVKSELRSRSPSKDQKQRRNQVKTAVVGKETHIITRRYDIVTTAGTLT